MILTRKFKLLFGATTMTFMLFYIQLCIYLLDITHKSNMEYLQNDVIPYNETVDLRIIVLAATRSTSLLRLLNSLNRAQYLNDNVEVTIWIDRSVEDNYDLDTYNTARSFNFLYGKKYVNVQPTHVGIFGQWIYTWNLSVNSAEIAVFLEDDVEVSRFFYLWLKLVHAKYDRYTNINGYSLHGTCENQDLFSPRGKYIDIPKTNSVFLYPAFNTWGFSPNKKHWMHFVNWVHLEIHNKTFRPFVPNIVPTLWYKEALRNGTELNNWDMWHVYHAYVNQLFTMFPNLPGDLGLSVHWKEKGLHYGENKSKTPSGKLLLEWISQLEALPDHPIYLDFGGRQIPYT